MMKKRGLSDVVTNVLLILVVIVAVSIVAAVVISLTRDTTGGISSECLTINLEVVSCDTTSGNVVVKRNAGKGDLGADVNLIVNGAPTRLPIPAPGLAELGQTTFTAVPGVGSGATEVSVGAIIAGSDQVCAPLNSAKTCL